MFKWFKKKILKKGLTWYNVTLDQYLKLKELDMNEFDDQIQGASILLGINSDDMSWVDFCKEFKRLEFLKDPIPETIVRPSYTLNGKKYDCLYNLQELSVNRYMDFMKLAPTNDLVKILAVFLVPEGKSYAEGYDLDEVYKDIRTMNVVEAWGIFNFFQLEFRVSIKALKGYLQKSLKDQSPELQKAVSDIMEYYSMLDQPLNGLD